METVYTIREFRKNMAKILDLVDSGVHIKVDRLGKVYTVSKGDSSSCEEPKKITAEVLSSLRRVGEYGCGCVRTEKAMCSKHQRV
jgi:hypothetical protein